MPLYPKQAMRRLIRQTDPSLRISGDADVLVYVDYVLFMKELAAKASEIASAAGEKEIAPAHVDQAYKALTMRLRG